MDYHPESLRPSRLRPRTYPEHHPDSPHSLTPSAPHINQQQSQQLLLQQQQQLLLQQQQQLLLQQQQQPQHKQRSSLRVMSGTASTHSSPIPYPNSTHITGRSRSHEPLTQHVQSPGQLGASTLSANGRGSSTSTPGSASTLGIRHLSATTSPATDPWRTSKIRHSGGFLLSDAFNSMYRAASTEDHRSKASSKSASSKDKAVPRRSGRSGRSASSHGVAAAASTVLNTPTPESPPTLASPVTFSSTSQPWNSSSPSSQPISEESEARKLHSSHSDRPDSSNTDPDSTASGPTFDVDSAQLIDMALRINQSRRIASQRSPSQSIPPRLVPLQDASVSGTLRHHLTQQRKLSRTGSPRSDRPASIQLRFSSPGSGKNLLGLPSAFDSPTTGFEPNYRFQFSQSTLARAQKARHHLELMAQYRNLLAALPPIPTRLEVKGLTSPPDSPMPARQSPMASTHSHVVLGRHYNPLQYIRNRTVRARERKPVDGESQGFADVTRVSDWVHLVQQRQNWDQNVASVSKGSSTLPPYEPAERMALETLLPAAQAMITNKPWRPRLDWEIDPADMLADIYWIEKGHNKQFLQDREWNAIFPPTLFAPPPPPPLPQQLWAQASLTGITRQNTDVAGVVSERSSASQFLEYDDHHHHLSDTLKNGFDSDHGHSKTAKARHKLHTFKPGHKHSSSNFSHHDLLRRSRNSLSDDDSESEVDTCFPRPNRSATLTSHSKDILDKQMQEYTARQMEQQQNQQLQLPHPMVLTNAPPSPDEVVSDAAAESKPPSRLHSRPGSLLDLSDAEELRPAEKVKDKNKEKGKRTNLISPRGRRPSNTPLLNRSSLDVPLFNRPSIDLDQPQSDTPIEGVYASDSSRQASPSRNPFHLVKSILQDRSREHMRDQSIERVLEKKSETPAMSSPIHPTPTPESAKLTPEHSEHSEQSGRKDSNTSARSGLEFEPAKPTRSTTSRTEATNSVRDMLRSPGMRIDNVIRGGFSKLGGMIWRKDGDSDSEAEVVSEVEGNHRIRFGHIRRDTALAETDGSTSKGKTATAIKESISQKKPADSSSETLSTNLMYMTPFRPNMHHRESCRFDTLKPPRIDIQAASPLSDRSRAPSFGQSVSPGRPFMSRLNSSVSRRMEEPQMIHIPDHLQPLSDGPIAARPRAGKDKDIASQHPSISRRELARIRALIVSSGITAMQVAHIVQKPQFVFTEAGALPNMPAKPVIANTRSLLQDVARLSKHTATPISENHGAVSLLELYPVAAHALNQVLLVREAEWQTAAGRFQGHTVRKLEAEVSGVREIVQGELLAETQWAADDAEEVSREMAMRQGLRAKRVEEVIEKMLRRKRRRFRWLRRGMWLGVECLLVGIMWYVWFVVTITRVVLGVGKGVVGGVRWLFWL